MGRLEPPGRTKRRRWVTLALLLVVLAALVPRYVRKGLKGNDFGAYYAAAVAVVSGDDLYDTRSEAGFEYLYPPTLAVLLVPLTVLGERPAAVIWVALNLLALALVLGIAARLLSTCDPPSREGMLVLGVLCVFAPLESDFLNGQANVLVLLCVAGAWLFLAGERPFAGGVAIALGTCLKVTPGIFLLYLLMRRSLRGVVGFALGALVFGLVLPALAMGPRRALDTNRQWLAGMVGPVIQRTSADGEIDRATERFEHGADVPGAVPFQQGHGMRPVLYRWLTPSRLHFEPDARRAHVVALSPALVEWIYRGLALLIVGLALLACRSREPSPSSLARDVALLATTMVLVAPLSRKAHFVACLLAALYLAWRFVHLREKSALGWLGAATLLFMVPMWFVPLPWPVRRDLVALGCYLPAGFALWLPLLLRGLGCHRQSHTDGKQGERRRQGHEEQGDGEGSQAADG